MKRPLSLLTCFTLAACSGDGEASPETGASDRGAGDSTMVVASDSMVPSEAGPRVVFLGTSLTAGLGLSGPEESYVAALDALADSAGLPFHAVNAGVSGETSSGGLRRLDWALREPLDVLFLELGANDGLRGHDVEVLQANLLEIIERTRTRNPDVRIVLAGMEAPPNLGERYTSAFREVFTEVTEQTGVVLVPFLLEGVAGVSELNQSDRIHPTAEGHRRMAGTAWPYLARALRSLGRAERTAPAGDTTEP